MSGKISENWNFEIHSSKSISVTKTEWEWYPICWTWAKKANSTEFPDFQKNSGRISGKLEFWNSELKIDFSDQNWVGMIPNMLDLALKSQFQRFSRFPENFWKNFWKTGILKFWAQNQVQWQKLSGKNTQYIEIGQNQPIPGNFQISRFPDSRFQKITDVAKSVQNYCEYVVLIVSANI